MRSSSLMIDHLLFQHSNMSHTLCQQGISGRESNDASTYNHDSFMTHNSNCLLLRPMNWRWPINDSVGKGVSPAQMGMTFTLKASMDWEFPNRVINRPLRFYSAGKV